jgi:hypothetical protein
MHPATISVEPDQEIRHTNGFEIQWGEDLRCPGMDDVLITEGLANDQHAWDDQFPSRFRNGRLLTACGFANDAAGPRLTQARPDETTGILVLVTVAVKGDLVTWEPEALQIVAPSGRDQAAVVHSYRSTAESVSRQSWLIASAERRLEVVVCKPDGERIRLAHEMKVPAA